MSPGERSDLHRLSEDELLLVHNYRRLPPGRQDVLLYVSDELAKQEKPTKNGNVFLLTGRK